VIRPPLLFRLYALLVFPWAVAGSFVWWWRIHVNVHGAPNPDCPFCRET
jgi:hypothetical protein